MKFLLILLISIILTGCVSFPSTSYALKKETERVYVFCSGKDQKETYELLISKFHSCYGGSPSEIPISAGGIYTFVSVDTRIEGKYSENGISTIDVSMRGGLAPRLHGAAIEVYPGSSCKTNVKVYVVNAFWENRAEHVKAWLNNQDVNCKYL